MNQRMPVAGFHLIGRRLQLPKTRYGLRRNRSEPLPVIRMIQENMQTIFHIALIRHRRQHPVHQHARPFGKESSGRQNTAIGKEGSHSAPCKKTDKMPTELGCQGGVFAQDTDHPVKPVDGSINRLTALRPQRIIQLFEQHQIIRVRRRKSHQRDQ